MSLPSCYCSGVSAPDVYNATIPRPLALIQLQDGQLLHRLSGNLSKVTLVQLPPHVLAFGKVQRGSSSYPMNQIYV